MLPMVYRYCDMRVPNLFKLMMLCALVLALGLAHVLVDKGFTAQIFEWARIPVITSMGFFITLAIRLQDRLNEVIKSSAAISATERRRLNYDLGRRDRGLMLFMGLGFFTIFYFGVAPIAADMPNIQNGLLYFGTVLLTLAIGLV